MSFANNATNSSSLPKTLSELAPLHIAAQVALEKAEEDAEPEAGDRLAKVEEAILRAPIVGAADLLMKARFMDWWANGCLSVDHTPETAEGVLARQISMALGQMFGVPSRCAATVDGCEVIDLSAGVWVLNAIPGEGERLAISEPNRGFQELVATYLKLWESRNEKAEIALDEDNAKMVRFAAFSVKNDLESLLPVAPVSDNDNGFSVPRWLKEVEAIGCGAYLVNGSERVGFRTSTRPLTPDEQQEEIRLMHEWADNMDAIADFLEAGKAA